MADKIKPKMGAMFGGQQSGTFLGVPAAELGECSGAKMVILGAPSATPYSSVGTYCADAPDAVRAAFGWPGVLEHHDFDLGGKIFHAGTHAVDWGNLSYSETDFEFNRKAICGSVKQILQGGAIPVVLGGDDSIPIPVFQAYEKYGPITILQLDAHIDWRDTVSGETMGLSSNMRRASEMPWVESIVQIGARGMGSARPEDYADAVAWGVKFFPMSDIEASGFDGVIEAIPENSRVFITLDIDAMDPAIVPSVIGPAPGGFRYWQVVNLFKEIAKRNEIVGIDLVELMPANDIGGRGALVAARLVAVMLGLISRQ